MQRMYDIPSFFTGLHVFVALFAEKLLQQPMCSVMLVPYSSVVTFACLLMIDVHVIMFHVSVVPVTQFFFHEVLILHMTVYYLWGFSRT